jgi:hypothetical protein
MVHTSSASYLATRCVKPVPLMSAKIRIAPRGRAAGESARMVCREESVFLRQSRRPLKAAELRPQLLH